MHPFDRINMAKLYDKHLKVVLNKSHLEVMEMTDGLGLSARVSKTGKVRWQYRYKVDGKNKRMDLGNYPDLSLLKARELHQQCREWLAQGYDPKHQLALRRDKSLKPVSVKEALEYWLVNYAEDNRANASKHRAQFKRHIYQYIGHLPLERVETRHWTECFDRIRKGVKGKQRPAPVAAGYVLQNAKQALRFCRVRRYASSRVLDDLTISDVGSKQRKKDRVLSAQELLDVWRFIKEGRLLPYYAKLVRLLIAFGARSHEIRLSTWAEWDFNEMLWTVPKENSKTGERIIRPIPEELKHWLFELKDGTNDKDFVLGEMKSPEAVSQYGRMLWKRLEHTEAWTLHDLRRTLATCLNDLGIAPHIVEQLLGHSLGGVMAIYNRSQYLPEKRAALDMWLEHLDVLAMENINIIPIRA